MVGWQALRMTSGPIFNDLTVSPGHSLSSKGIQGRNQLCSVVIGEENYRFVFVLHELSC